MATFWAVYFVVWLYIYGDVDWRELREELLVTWIRPVVIRGGVVVAGLQAIYIAIGVYLSR